MISSSARRATALDAGEPARADAWHPADLAFVPPPERAPSAPDPVTDAYALGFEEGFHEGELAEQTRLQAARRAAEDALDVIRANEERWSDSISENIVALAVAVARHVVDRELALDPGIVEHIVSRAIAAFPIDQPVRVRVNPNDLAVLDAAGLTAGDGMDGAEQRPAHWIADAQVKSGGCVVEGRDRIVDGRVDTALERVYRRLAHQNA
jgi:flagellar biosynthesis/type III secretory pathway protein FliH